MLDRLQAMGWLTHVHNDGPHDKGPQWSALKAAAAHPLTKSADWIIVMDIDEFINIHTGDRTIPALLAALPDADAIALTWRMFGNAGIVHLTDTPVTALFTHAAPDPLDWPWRAVMYKTLYRNARFGQPGVHRPKANPMPPAGMTARGAPAGRPPRIFSPLGQPHYGLAQLNHYALGSMEGYLVKAIAAARTATPRPSTLAIGWTAISAMCPTGPSFFSTAARPMTPCCATRNWAGCTATRSTGARQFRRPHEARGMARPVRAADDDTALAPAGCRTGPHDLAPCPARGLTGGPLPMPAGRFTNAITLPFGISRTQTTINSRVPDMPGPNRAEGARSHGRPPGRRTAGNRRRGHTGGRGCQAVAGRLAGHGR